MKVFTVPYAIIASQSRMTYAFARDGGIPFSFFFHYLDPNQIPTRIILLIVVLDILIIIPSVLSASLYAAINSLGTVGTLYNYNSQEHIYHIF